MNGNQIVRGVGMPLDHTPPSSLDPNSRDRSSPKRPRLANSTASTASDPMQDVTMQDTRPDQQLRDLPMPILLLIIASDLHSQALALHPILARRPSSTNSITRYSHAWNRYAQLLGGAITCLRVVLSSCTSNSGSRDGAGGRIELRTRCLLAETLVRLTSGHPRARREAEVVINQGVSSSQEVLLD